LVDPELDIRRIQSLTDAVFAIAMTIIILEIKIPPGMGYDDLKHYFIEHTLRQLFIYLLGFVTLGILWIGSHFHHHHVVKTDRISSWLNILFLMFVSLIPFSVGFLYTYRHEKISLIFLSINLIFASFSNYFMLSYAWRRTYIRPYFTRDHFIHAKRRILFPVLIYLIIILISFFAASIALYLFLIPVIVHIFPEKGNYRT
jgi:uncharacterized membrane protein